MAKRATVAIYNLVKIYLNSASENKHTYQFDNSNQDHQRLCAPGCWIKSDIYVPTYVQMTYVYPFKIKITQINMQSFPTIVCSGIMGYISHNTVNLLMLETVNHQFYFQILKSFYFPKGNFSIQRLRSFHAEPVV